jgi:hypothetical protein
VLLLRLHRNGNSEAKRKKQGNVGNNGERKKRFLSMERCGFASSKRGAANRSIMAHTAVVIY